MYVVLGEQTLPLGQLGPGHCILEQPAQFAPRGGEIVLNIDGSESRLPVYFPDGATQENCRVSYVLQASTVPSELLSN